MDFKGNCGQCQVGSPKHEAQGRVEAGLIPAWHCVMSMRWEGRGARFNVKRFNGENSGVWRTRADGEGLRDRAQGRSESGG